MSRMSVIQQTQSLPEHPLIARKERYHLCLTGVASALVVLITLTAGAVFSLAAALLLNLSAAIYLKDRWVTRLFAGAATAVLVALSTTVLFPVTLPIAVSTTSFIAALSFSHAFIQVALRSS